MRVVVLESYAPALLSFRGNLIQEMVTAGHDVVACAPGEERSVIEGLERVGARYVPVRLERTGVNPLRDLGSIACLTRLFRRLAPDLLAAYTAKPVIYGSLAARLAGVRWIFTTIEGLGYAFSDQVGVKARALRVLTSWLYTRSLRWSAGVFVLNQADRDLLLTERIVCDAQKLHLVDGIGVDLAHYRFVPFRQDKPVFLMVCRLLRQKGVKDFVETACLLKPRYPEVVFRLLGPLEAHPDAVRQAELRAWVEQGLIEYLGETDDVRPFLQGCSAFVLPSFYREGLPRTILEAMATGRAIVTADVPGCRETVVPGQNGFLVPPRDARALAEALERLILEPELAPAMGTRSRELAERKFDVRRINAIMLRTMNLV